MKYLAIFGGSRQAMDEWMARPDRKEMEQKGMQAWMDWVQANADKIAVSGSPLGKTKRVDKSGVSDTRNELGAWVVVQAESHAEAAELFEDHPHFTIFPGEWIEVMECLPMPQL